MSDVDREPEQDEHQVTPLELFFDLVFVFAITQVTILLADDPTWDGAFRGMLVLAALWWAWSAYAWLTSAMDVDEGGVRLVMLASMGARRVRAIDERYYGRTARTFYVGAVNRPGEDATTVHANALSVAAAESVPAHEADRLRTILRHARIPGEQAAGFWEQVMALSREFAAQPRSGGTVYGFAAGLYPTDYPTLPDTDDELGGRSAERET